MLRCRCKDCRDGSDGAEKRVQDAGLESSFVACGLSLHLLRSVHLSSLNHFLDATSLR